MGKDELGEALERLAISNRELEQFAYVASHDLKEPARMVSSYCALIREEYGDRLDDQGRVYLDFAIDGANRMLQLIDGLLTLSRTGREVCFEEVSVAAALWHALEHLKLYIEENGVVVTHDHELPVVHADHMMLVRLFINLVGNAIKFRATDRQPEVHIGYEDLGDRWRVVVRDNGLGFDMKHAQRIFLLFQRLGSRKNGTGIGLSVCQKIVERLGGEIWAESVPGTGSAFFFILDKDGIDEASPAH